MYYLIIITTVILSVVSYYIQCIQVVMYVLPYYNNYCNTRYLIIYSVYR